MKRWHRKYRKMWKGSLVLFGVLLIAASAFAHAFPDHSEPRVGSEGGPPSEVKIWFDGPLEPVFSDLQVFDHSGKQVDKGDAKVNPKDDTLLQVTVPPLPPGEYKVAWGVVARDGHRTEGNFKFWVK
ncbi:MAG TPA: copper resistance protein CopC [Nitrospiria bacterium]|nr:copper resistance protein CopC [Nitrospiria bacterium]